MLFAPHGNLPAQLPETGDGHAHRMACRSGDRYEPGDRLVVPGDDDLLSPRYAIEESPETAPRLRRGDAGGHGGLAETWPSTGNSSSRAARRAG